MKRMIKSLINFFIITSYVVEPGSGGGGTAPGDGGTDGAGTQNNDMIQVKDPQTGVMVDVPKGLESFVNHLVSGTRGVVKRELDEKYGTLMSDVESRLKSKESENADVLSQLEELREENLTAEEKVAKKIERKLLDFEQQIQSAGKERDNWKDMFFKHKTKADIMSSFGNAVLCNPEQTSFIFLNEGRAEVREMIDNTGKGTGEYETIMSISITDKDGKVEEMSGTPLQLFEKWINQSKNAHHLQNNLQPGGGSHFSGASGDNIDPAVLKDMNPVEKLKLARRQK